MPLTTDHYDMKLAADGSMENVEAIATALQEVFPADADIQERIGMAKKITPLRAMQTTLRYSVQGVLNTLFSDADWRRNKGYAVAH